MSGKVMNNADSMIKAIPHGGKTAIALSANVSVDTVYNVLKGKSQNPKVLSAIDAYLSNIKNVKNSIKENLNNLKELSFE